MAVRRFVAQSQEENQILKMDSASRFVVNDISEWQFLFGPNSELSNSAQLLKIAAELDPDSLNKIRFTSYLFNPITGGTDSAATCQFSVYKVINSGWQDNFLFSFGGVQQNSNNYFYAEKLVSDFLPTDLDGGITLMVEVLITRLGINYRDRIYINHLGTYERLIKLRQDVTFLELTKQDE